MRRTASSAATSSGALSSPASDAQVPDVRASPVRGSGWKRAPRANEPGNSPAYQSARKRRCRYASSPTRAASSGVIAQPMSSWQRT